MRRQWPPGVQAAIGFAAAIFFLLAAIAEGISVNGLRDHGLRAQATVVEVHGGRSSYVMAEFTTNRGQFVLVEVDDYYWIPRPQVGDTATLIYEPDNPANVQDARIAVNHTITIILVLSGLMMLALASWYLRQAIRRK
ncbi:DUF3592 domain-containing protein [Microtetraspora malaysiensis]|uniref:DUF3592 domain-containing protein n=1 Tax=Microtetraspora malaysiensis TaxID=161358 RepID=UPI003D8C3483